MEPTSIVDWSKIVPVVIGGGISIVSTVAMFSLAQFVDRRKRAKDRVKEDAVATFVGFWKLKAVAETLGNLHREIADAFAAAESIELTNAEPCDIVRGRISSSSQLELLSAKELLFLNREKRSDLMVEADLIVRRAMDIEQCMSVYTQLRSDCQHFIETHADAVDVPVGTTGGFSLSGNAAAIAKLKKHAMNDILEQVRGMLDRDYVQAKFVTNEYLRIARQHFGVNFPEFDLKWVVN